MKKNRLITAALLAGSLLLASVASGQDTNPPPRPRVDDELKELIADFREQRRDVLEALRHLRERLANASEEERRRILEEFRREVRERNEAERELRRELRQRRLEIIRERRAAAAAGD